MRQLEQDQTRRSSSVRLRPPNEPRGGVVVDLLFASSGIEREVVRSSLELIERRGFDRQKNLLREYQRLVRPDADDAEDC